MKEFQTEVQKLQNDDWFTALSLVDVDYLFKATLDDFSALYIVNNAIGNYTDISSARANTVLLSKTIKKNLEFGKLTQSQRNKITNFFNDSSLNIHMKNCGKSQFFIQLNVLATTQFDYDPSQEKASKKLQGKIDSFLTSIKKVQSEFKELLKSFNRKENKINEKVAQIHTGKIKQKNQNLATPGMKIISNDEVLAKLFIERANTLKAFSEEKGKFDYGIRCSKIDFSGTTSCFSLFHFKNNKNVHMMYLIDPSLMDMDRYANPKGSTFFDKYLKHAMELGQKIKPPLKLEFNPQIWHSKGRNVVDLQKHFCVEKLIQEALYKELKSFEEESNKVIKQYSL